MPINVPLLTQLEKKYGPKSGESVYFGMEKEGKRGFKKGVKTASKQGLTVPHLKTLKTKHGRKIVREANRSKTYRQNLADHRSIRGVKKTIYNRMHPKKSR